MTDIDVVQYLSSKGYHGKKTTGVETVYPCFFDCGEPADSRKLKLYVNSDTGMYHCKVCEAFGGSTLLQRHFGDQPQHAEPAFSVHRRAAVLEAVTRVGETGLRDDDDVMLYLLGDKRYLPPALIESRRIGYIGARSLTGALPTGEFTADDVRVAGIVWQSGPTAGQDFFRDAILIPYIENGRVVQVRGKSMRDGRYYTGPGEHCHLYNADALKGADDVLLVEGEFDTMMVADLLSRATDIKMRSVAVVGLPGVHSLPDDFDDLLADAKRIYIGFDPDEPGRRGTQKLQERIGNRAHVLEWPSELLRSAQADGLSLKEIDWTVWIGRYGATWQDVCSMIRQSSRLASMVDAGSRFRNRPRIGGLKTGFSELDAWIHPGLLPGQVMIPLAKTGVGKTIFLCNLAYNMRDRRVLFITLEMTQEEIYERIVRIYRFYRPEATAEEVEFALADLRICDENRLSEFDFAQLVDEYVEDVGDKPDLVIVDYLGYYARGMKGGSPYEKTSNGVMQLKAEAKKHRVAVIAPHQVNRMAKAGKPLDADDARDSGVVEETADFLIAIYRPDDTLDVDCQGQPTGKLRLSVLKSRHGNKDRVCTLQMGLLSLVIVDDINPRARGAAEECYLLHRGTTYESYLAERTKPRQLQLGKGA